MKKIKYIKRAIMALFFPLLFLKWVNNERCYAEVHNDAGGMWYVKIGQLEECGGRTIGRAMYAAFQQCECHPGWKWTTDFLEEI